jgi:hypothetical protein
MPPPKPKKSALNKGKVLSKFCLSVVVDEYKKEVEVAMYSDPTEKGVKPPPPPPGRGPQALYPSQDPTLLGTTTRRFKE